MKSLSWKLILPITIISFTTFTKWWYVNPVDAPDSMMYGFPIPYTIDGWHTSMSLQIFILELIFDLSVYFLFWYTLVWLINKYAVPIKMHRIIAITLISISGLCALSMLFIASWPENVIHLKNPYQVEILETGYQFIGQGNQRPENFTK